LRTRVITTVRDKPAVSRSHITFDMVRAFVAQAGLARTRAMAAAAGMTASEERRAMVTGADARIVVFGD
jgi:hypothetical protein